MINGIEGIGEFEENQIHGIAAIHNLSDFFFQANP